MRTIIVYQPATPTVIKIASTGPQGPKGDTGDTGPAGAGYTLPVATSSVLGGIKQGTGVTIAGDGTLSVSGGGGGGSTNLTYSADTTSVTIASDTGTDATILASSGSIAGVMTSAQFTKLAGIATGATVGATWGSNITGQPSTFTPNLDSTFTTVRIRDAVSGYSVNLTVPSLADDYDITVPAAGIQPLDAVLTATTASFTTAQQTKLSGIATGATANSSDATLLARANHTGTQSYTTITGLGSLATLSAAPAGTLTGTTLASGVTASSLVSVGTITTGVWQGTAIADTYISSATTWNAKQAALVSGTNIKTVNGSTLLGSGDLTVGGMTNPMTTAGDTIYGGASGTPTRLAVGVPGGMYSLTSASVPVWYRRDQLVTISEEFIRNTADSTIFDFNNSGTGAAATIVASTSSILDDSCFGVGQFSTGTTTTGSMSMFAALQFSWIATAPSRGAQYTEFISRVRLENLSDATDTFTVRVGMLGALDDASRGSWFKYTNGTNSGQWQCLSRDASSVTTTNTTSTVAAGTWYTLRIVHTGTGTAYFYVNGTLVATNSTNVPTDYFVPAGLIIVKSAGTTARLMYIDYIQSTTLLPSR
jgi:hypothetical protein